MFNLLRCLEPYLMKDLILPTLHTSRFLLLTLRVEFEGEALNPNKVSGLDVHFVNVKVERIWSKIIFS